MAKKKDSAATTLDKRLDALRGQAKAELVALLAELAATNSEAEERLARHTLGADPARLAAEFRTRLQAWKRSRRFLGRSAAADFSRALEAWLDEVERELLPLDPARAQALAEAFLRNDERFFEQADDSDGAIGDAIRAGCQLWLRAAKAQPNRDATKWIERVYALVNADEYGAREALLKHSDLLFDEAGLRALASRFEADLTQALHARGPAERHGHAVYRAAAAVGLIADALRDPDLSTRTTLRYSPNPNALQKERFAERYMRFGRPREALAWLDGEWGYREEGRERLLAEAYAAMGDTARLRAVRQALFERTGSASDFEAWRESLAPADRANATEVARERAAIHDDPITGARLLFTLGDDAAAEVLLLARHATLQGGDYDRLVPLAQALETKGRPLGTIVCHRALLVAILTRAYARAYGHAAEYLQALRRLDSRVDDYGSLTPHQAFELSIRSTHGRKVSFWNRTRA
ncbi:MAG: DUF6880 family protein [Betaproteobacteria bacterium]